MIGNVALLIFEILALGILILFLHSISPRYGLIPMIAFMVGLTVFLKASTMTLVYIRLSAHQLMMIAPTTYVPVILLGVLVLYVIEGTIPARASILSILGASVLYQLLFLSNRLHLAMAGGRSFFDLNMASPQFAFDLQGNLSSLLAFAADLLIIVVVYQFVLNKFPRWPAWIAPGLALLVSLWSDTLLYQVSCCGVPDLGIFSRIADDMMGTTLAGLVLWPVAGIYLTRIAPRLTETHAEKHRPVFDVLLRSFGSVEADLVRTETSLKESALLYRSLVDVLPMCVCRKDLEGRIIFANQRYCDDFNLSQIEILGKTDFDLHPRDLAEKYHSDDLAVMAGGKTVEIFEEHQPINGTRTYVQVFKTPLYDARGQLYGLQIIFWDVTEKKLAELQAKQMNETLEKRVLERTIELEAVNRELESFSYSVSHDLRAPLRAISGYIHIIQSDFGDLLPPDGQSYLMRVIGSSVRMNELIDDLLDFSRTARRIPQKRTVDTRPLVDSVIDTLSSTIGDRKIHWNISELPSVEADQVLLQQVFANLIENALKYTSKRDESHIEIGSMRQDGQDVFYIRDDGVGFNMKYANKLFGVFQRLHREEDFEGTGIGLATVQRIIQRHGGRIWAESEPNQGATFYFTLS
jgi:PAS domain S-box-containing protein